MKHPGRILVQLALACGLWCDPALAQTRTLTIATHYTDGQLQPLTACFRQFEAENVGIRIVHRQSTYADFLQTILTGRLSGNAPDIYNLYSIWGARLVQSRMLAEPPPDLVQYVEQSYAATTRDAIAVNGKLWGVPSEVSTYMLIYNRKLFKDAGIEHPPTTLNEFSDVAKRLSKVGPNGALTIAGTAYGQTVANAVAPFRTLLLSAGHTLFSADGRSTNLLKPEALAILERQTALFRDGATSPAFEVQGFAGGNIGMMIMANWVKRSLSQGFGDAFNDTVGVAPIPTGPDWKTYQYAFFYGVDANSRSQAESWRFIRWLNTPRGDAASCTGEMLAELGALTGHTEDRKRLGAQFGDAFTRPFVKAIEDDRAVAEPNIPRASEAERALSNAINSVWAGKAEAAAALIQADQQISAVLREGR